jgi:organic hydroperoxide reductase OsmC/OhrA
MTHGRCFRYAKGSIEGKLMSEHKVDLLWKGNDHAFSYETYPRDHELRFDNGKTITASSAPAYFGNSDAIDPEEMLVAALSSCHMLTFLAVASKRGYVVVEYQDHAVGYLDKNSTGKMAITTVTLNPSIQFSQDKIPSPEELSKLHDKAHENCFIANSVMCEITVKSG